MKLIHTTEPIVARSFSFLWFKRVYLGTEYLGLSARMQRAVRMHEYGHIHRHHTEIRILLALSIIGLLFAPWVAKYHEYSADAYTALHGCGPDLYQFLRVESPGGLWHPSNYQRRQKLVHNKFFA